MRYFTLILVILLFVSCVRNKDQKIKKLPINSATKLINETKVNELITKSSPKNIDLINGFRGVKLLTNIDSIYLKDWQLNKFSNKIVYFEKSTVIKIQDKMYEGKVCLTFYENILVMIDINFNNIDAFEKKEMYSMDDAKYKVIEPSFMNIFYTTFGRVEPFVMGNRVNDLSMDLYELLSESAKTGKKEKKTSYINHVNTKSLDKTFERNLYKVFEEKTRVKKPTENDYKLPPNTVIGDEYENKKLYEYLGVKNGLKLLITNNFEIFEPVGKISFQYKLKKIKLQVKIYNKIAVDEYISAKISEEKLIENELKMKNNNLRKKIDSIKLKESSTQL